MKKLIVISFILIFFVNCSTKKEMTLRQVSTDREAFIYADTITNRAIGIYLSFVFEFMNPHKEGRRLEDAVYMYHTRYYADSSRVAGIRGWTSNGSNRAELNGKLVRLNRANRIDRMVNNSGKIRNEFYPIKSIDTTRTTQAIFKPYIAKMKEQKTDTITIGPANRFIKEHPDFCRWTFEGDSIYFKVYNMDNKLDTIFVRRIQLLTE